MYNVNDRIDELFIITDIRFRKTQAGNDFMTATLIHGKERIKLICWGIAAFDASGMNGLIVRVQGTIGEYRGEKQLVAEQFHCVNVSDVQNIDDIVPTAPIDTDVCFIELSETVECMRDPDLKQLCKHFLLCLEHNMKRIPAAKSIHHAFVGGLLMHVYMMLCLAKTLCLEYARLPGRESAIDFDLLYAGVIFHDIGKLAEFDLLDCGLVGGYSPEGRQFGHSVLGAMIIDNNWNHIGGFPSYKIDQLKHLILSHHGCYEYGAAALPMTLEAIILSLLDSLDSKTEAAMEALIDVQPGGFTEKLYAFDGRQLYKPAPYNLE